MFPRDAGGACPLPRCVVEVALDCRCVGHEDAALNDGFDFRAAMSRWICGTGASNCAGLTSGRLNKYDVYRPQTCADQQTSRPAVRQGR